MSKKEKNKVDQAVTEEANIPDAEETTANIPDVEEAPEKAVEDAKDNAPDWQDRYIRMLAEFDNYKKRTQREREQLYKDATIDTISSFLPIVDALQRAAQVEVSNDEAKGVLDGIKAIQKQFEDIFSQIGVKAIDAVGKEFDPNLHDAVMHIEDDSYGSNVIVEEFSRGYQYKDKVIRHSMVKVAN